MSKKKKLKKNLNQLHKIMIPKYNIDIGAIPEETEIENTIPKTALDEWQKGDSNPYYKIQAIAYPIVANSWNYKESFFNSFAENLKKYPFPGSKDGHEMGWGKRGKTHFIVTGIKVKSNGDGTGICYIKNYIPPNIDNESNETFIKECKTDMIHFSLVSYTEDEIIKHPDGSYQYNVVKSLYGERNDAVTRGTGAMDQKTNQREEQRIMRSALHALVKKADQQGLTELSETASKLIKLIESKQSAGGGDNNLNKGDTFMTKDELTTNIKTLKQNAITLPEIADAMGVKDQIVTQEHTNALSIINELKKINCVDPVKEITELRGIVKANAHISRNANLDKEFGPEKIKVGTVEKVNALRVYAGGKLLDVPEADYQAKLNELKTDPVAQALAAESAAYDSPHNTIEAGKQNQQQQQPTKTVAGATIVEY